MTERGTAWEKERPADVADLMSVGSAAGQGEEGAQVLLGDLIPIDDAEDCFVVGEVNQQALFGRVTAVVHHGGAGTTTTASRAGTPQVVVPQIADQPYWAARVATLGIGPAHDGPTPTRDSLSSRSQRL